MNILVTGASGFIAQNFVKFGLNNVKAANFILLTRDVEKTKNIYTSIFGNSLEQYIKENKLVIIDEITKETPIPQVVINLAGAPIISSSFFILSFNNIVNSRVKYTRDLCQKLKELKKFPQVFINASAIGIYNKSSIPINENCSNLGGNFLANLALDWENCAYEGCKTTTARLVLLRFANVIGESGAFLTQTKNYLKYGIGNIAGSEEQYLPWISINDTIRAIAFCISNNNLKGAVNITSPNQDTYSYYCQTLASLYNKKLWFKAPKFCIHLSKGKVAPALLNSLNVEPTRLLENGFKFHDTNLHSLLANELGF